MKRFLIEDAKCGISNGGMVSDVVACVRFNDGDVAKWLYYIDTGAGIPMVCETYDDIYDKLIENNGDDEEFYKYVDNHTVSEFNGLEIGDEGELIFDSIYSDPKNPAAPLLKYIVTLCRCGSENTDGLINMAINKYVDELEIPASDIEQEYLEENAEDED